MSTATLPTIKDLAIDRLNSTVEQYIKDLSYIPEEKLGVVPMGAARTALDFTAEVIGFNVFVAKSLRGEEIRKLSDEERTAFIASINSRAVAERMLTDSVSGIASELQKLTEQELLEPVTLPWGATEAKFTVANMAAGHMTYHDGQLNYIQALFGDGVNHWGE